MGQGKPLFHIPIVDNWLIVNNSSEKLELIAEGTKNQVILKNKKYNRNY